MVATPTSTDTEQSKKERGRSVALGKVNVLVALLGLLLLAGAYWINLLPEALALMILTLSLLTAASRAWHARRGGLEYGLLRHPFRRELRPHLLQCLNHWLFLALFGAAIVAGPGPRSAGSHRPGGVPRRPPHPERERVDARGGGPKAWRPRPPDRGLTACPYPRKVCLIGEEIRS